MKIIQMELENQEQYGNGDNNTDRSNIIIGVR